MTKNEIIKTAGVTLGVLGGLIAGSLFAVLVIILLTYNLHWFEGMKLMVALLIIPPAAGIAGAILTGFAYNKRLKGILAAEITRKKELAAMLIIPVLLIGLTTFPRVLSYAKTILPAEKVNFTDAMGRLFYSSSELNKPADNAFGDYGAQNLFDGDKGTCWAEGVKGPGEKEYIYLDIPPEAIGLSIINGYAKTEQTFKNNNRARRVKLSLYRLSPPKEGEVTEAYTPMKIRQLSFALTPALLTPA